MSDTASALRAAAERLMDYNIPVERQLNFDAAALMLKAAEEMEWRPIETFPQDGEGYLVCDARALGGSHEVVCWEPKEPGSDWCLSTSDGPTYHKNAFTHWRPLPSPPAPAASTAHAPNSSKRPST